MFQVFQTFQMYVVTISYGCYKSRSEMLHMLQAFHRYVASVLEVFQNGSFVPDVCCKRFDLDVA
jgi:hypothetical protein